MKLSAFKLERYFAQYEFSTQYLLCASDCESLSLGELLDFEPNAAEDFKKLWLGYTESQGHPALRSQIAKLYKHLKADQVLVHAGAEEAIFNFMNVFLERGDHVIVHFPCYQSLIEVVRAIGCEITRWEGQENEGWRLSPESLEGALQKNTKLVIINCPHNPTGFLMTRPELEQVVQLSQKHGFLIFSDEVYRGLEYEPKDTLPAVCDLDGRGVSLGVMSKIFGLPGLRIGWVAARDRVLYEKLAQFKDYTTICNSAPSEYLGTLALRHHAKLITRNLNLLKQNLAVLEEFFRQHQDTFSWNKPIAGPIGFPRYLGPDGTQMFCQRLLSTAGVLLLPSILYDYGDNHFRLGFGRKNLKECVLRLETFLEQRKRN
jgi:aspartate/methionine/tyrosine aminotransferase